MEILSAAFVKSSVKVSQCPIDKKPEFAFIGRSNVGKSSIINYLLQSKDLAKTSSKPGKTQHINHFLVNKQFYIVDLPGYGYAKTSQKNRKKWEQFISDYLLSRETLFCTFVLIDFRIEPQQIDLEFIDWMGENSIPFIILFTKVDKVKATAKKKQLENYLSTLLKTWETLPNYFLTSSEKKLGRTEILEFLAKTLNQN